MTLTELRDQRAQIKEQMKDLHRRASGPANATDYPQDYEAQFQRMKADFDRITSLIDNEETLKDIEGRFGKPVNQPEPKKEPSYEESFNRYIRSSRNRPLVTAADQEILMRGTSTQVVGTDNLGGYLVPDTWSTELWQYMKWYGGILDVADIITTNTGATLNVPYIDDTSNTGAIITETTGDVVLDVAVGSKTLGAFVFTSKIVKLSYELLQDDGYNLSGRLQSILGERLGRIANTKLTTGGGTTEPWGVVSRAANSSLTTSALARTDLVDLIHTVNKAYRMNGRFMFNDNTLSTIIKLSFGASDDRPLWVPSMRDGAPDTIEGYPYTINNDMADQAAAAKFILFGDFKQYQVRMVKGITLESSWEKYFGERVVGYNAYMRMDGELVGNVNAIKYLAGA